MTSVLVIRVTDYGVKMVDVVQVIETILRVFLRSYQLPFHFLGLSFVEYQ